MDSSNTTRYHILEDGTLMISYTNGNDSGYYHCMASNIAGAEKSRMAMLRTLPTTEDEEYDGGDQQQPPQAQHQRGGTFSHESLFFF